MRITPLDVRKQDFRKAVRGFDCDEVRAFLGTLADEYEAVLVDNKVLRERLTEQEEKLSEYQTMEKTLRDTLMTAERVMQETKDNATREGELVIQEAQLKAKGILEECRTRTEELRREMVSLRQEKETYLARFKTLAEAQIKFIDTHEDDFADLDARLIHMADTVIQKQGTTVKVNPIQTATINQDEDQWRDYSPTTSTGKTSAAAVDKEIMSTQTTETEADEITETAEAMAETVTAAVESTDETENATI